MSFRAGLNRALVKTTGYRISRAAPAPPRKPAPSPAKAATPAGKPVRKPALPADYDEDTREIWQLVRERTMTGHPKVHFLVEAVRYVVRHGIPGAMLECGVWRGGSMLTVAHTLQRLGVSDRDLYLYDTFSGMSEPTERDLHIFQGRTAEEMLDQRSGAPIWQPATLEDVQAGFAEISYPSERLHFVPGKVEDTIPEGAPDQIALLRLDTDWYESTRHEFTHLYDRLAPGGVLVIDDYGSWQGSKDATDEFLDETGEPLLLVRVGRGRVAIKPGLTSKVP